MLLILILVIICAVLLGIVTFSFETSWSEKLGITLLVIAASSALLILAFMIYAVNKPSSLILAKQVELVALPDNFHIDNRVFYAAVGYKDGKANIVYAYEEGEYIPVKRIAVAENVCIKEVESETAYLKVYYRMLENLFWNQFYFSKREYVLELPKGSVRYDYTFFNLE
ncbi:hypothetical protein [Mesotoga sp.]|uniref:hypothetical protein n=1 Tax=Mesotoga sp. TaxID=2053577 RepID=UPI00345EDC32